MSAVAPQQALEEVDAADWNELLLELGCADAYLLRAYVETATVLERARPAFLHLHERGGDVVFACLVRKIGHSRGSDVTTPSSPG